MRAALLCLSRGSWCVGCPSTPPLQVAGECKDILAHVLPLQDQKRMEKISKRVNAIEEVNNNVKLLTEMVTNYSKGETTESNEDLMKVRKDHPSILPGLSRGDDSYLRKFLLLVLHLQLSILLLSSTPLSPLPQELYQRCERMRPMLFRLASDTEDNDEALGKCMWCFSLCPLLPPSLREPVLGLPMAWPLSAASVLFGVAAYWRLVSLWLHTKCGHMAAISSVTGFFHFSVETTLVLVLLRLPWRCPCAVKQFGATIAKLLSAVRYCQLLGLALK